ncbi:MAG: LPS-assembly protein LptD [Candidatus Gastranaerophilales bacterium]|nr:LPS-assembly protein LptD [Candidatus Gastranaerophilales bacterium]
MTGHIKGIKKYFILALLMNLSLTSYAQYEVYKAKTVVNQELQKKEVKDNRDYLPTYNDPELPKFSDEKTVTDALEEKTKNFFERRRYNKLKKQSEEENKELQDEVVNEDDSSDKIYKPRETDNQVIENENRFQINADKVSYDDTDGNMYAKGNVEIIAKAKDTTIKADEAILDKAAQTIKLINNVKVIKGGVEMKGDSLLIDLNEQNALMDNPVLDAYSFNVVAQEGYIIANDIQMINGTIKSNRKTDYAVESRAFQSYENVATDYIRRRNIDRSNTERTTKQNYRVDAKEIIITSYKDHNSLLMKKANVYYNNHRILFNSDIEILSDKDQEVVEMSLPEAGSLRNFGTYVGYGFLTRLPKGQTLKLMPSLVYGDSNIGIGIIGRHRSTNNRLEAGWATSTSNLVVKGTYRLADHLNLRYGRNTYLSEGFMGARKSGYAAQLEHRQNFEVEGIKDLLYRQGIYAGIFSDYQKHRQEHAYATTRFRYTGELRKKLFEYQNKEQDMSIKLSAMAQGAATVYGSGETQGIIRIGPYVTTKLRFWESSIGYMIGGIHGDSPFMFDKYRYGKQTVLLNEQIHFGDKFALGYRANITPMKDNIDDKLLTESRFYAIFGPQDLKLVLSYDFVRDIAHFEFMFLLGTDSSRINFEKLITKNIDGGNRKRDFYRYAKPVKIVEPENM